METTGDGTTEPADPSASRDGDELADASLQHSSGPSDSPRWICALLGGAVAIVSLPLFPVSLATGGAVAAYRRKGETREGVIVGALAGLPPTVPVAAGAVYYIDATGWRIGADATGGFTGFDALYILILLLVFVPAIFAVLSAVGGALGVHIDEDL